MELNTGVSIQANKLDSATSYVVGLQHCTSKCTAIVSITLTAATIAWLKHRMKHISSLYLSSRKAANSAALLSPYKSCSPLHLWNDAPIFRALQGPYCFSNDHFVVRNDRIFHCLNIPQNSANLEYTSHLPKNVIIYCRPQLPPLGGAIIKESTFQFITHIYFVARSGEKFHNLLLSSVSTTRWHYNQGKCDLAYNSYLLCRTFRNLISTYSLNCAKFHDIGHAHFGLLFFFWFFLQIRKILQNYFFELLPGDFTNLHETLHTTSVASPDKKVIKRNLIFQTILKLLNDNFLYILLKTKSVACLHIGLSQWHETQVTTSPWATKALWKNYKLLFPTPPRPFDRFAPNFASSIWLIKSFHLCHTCWCAPFWCFSINH